MQQPTEGRAVRLLSIDDGILEGTAGALFPQSLLLEAMAQAASLLTASRESAPTGSLLAGVSRVSFGRPPRPGDRLQVEARLTQRHGDLIRISGKVREGREILAEGDIILALGADSRD